MEEGVKNIRSKIKAFELLTKFTKSSVNELRNTLLLVSACSFPLNGRCRNDKLNLFSSKTNRCNTRNILADSVYVKEMLLRDLKTFTFVIDTYKKIQSALSLQENNIETASTCPTKPTTGGRNQKKKKENWKTGKFAIQENKVLSLCKPFINFLNFYFNFYCSAYTV